MILDKFRGLRKKRVNRNLVSINTKRDRVMLILAVVVILFSFLNHVLILLDVVAILGYYFMPKYLYDNTAVWVVSGNREMKPFFLWKEVKQVDLNGEDLYFLLRNGNVKAIKGVRDAYKFFMVVKGKIS